MSFGTRASIASVSVLQTWRDQLASTLRHTASPEFTNASLLQDGETHSALNSRPKRHCTIATDYGTTNTSVSYHITTGDDDPFEPRASDIKTIGNWPDEENTATGGSKQVPTEFWYSTVPMKREDNSLDQFDEPADFKNGDYHKYVETGDDSDLLLDETQNRAAVSMMSTSSHEAASCSDDNEFLWGHSVAFQRDHLGLSRDLRLLVERPKLMMLNSKHTDADRVKLRKQVKWLIKNNIIRKYGKKTTDDMRDVRDLITDFLVKVFEHTKRQLEIYEDFDDQCTVDFVLAVPAIWSPQASRVLQASVEAAILASSFGKLVNDKLGNLFIVPEPEGGVLWMLHKLPTAPYGEIITSLDCGGGTVDAATYQVSNNGPLRLGEPIIPPTGDNCGGCYVNDNFKKHVTSRIMFEKYLEVNGNTIESIVNRVGRDFEANQKPTIDITRNPFRCVRIENLRGDRRHDDVQLVARKRCKQNILLMESQDYIEIYMPILNRIWDVLRGQLETARLQGSMMIFLVGGFAASPSVVSWLKLQLIDYQRKRGLAYRIRLVEDKWKSVVAISAGAVLRALDKANGPPRLVQSSYGFVRREPHEPDIWAGHKAARAYQDPEDEDWYVTVLNYFLVKDVTVLLPNHEFEPMTMTHTFSIDDFDKHKTLTCVEFLYVSDTATESHYPMKGAKNRDAQYEGRIMTDFTFLLEKNLIEVVEPQRDNKGVMRGKRHYRIEYDLVPMVKGRDLIYESRWPSANALSEVDSDRKRRKLEKHEFRQTAQVSLAAAFMPGTS